MLFRFQWHIDKLTLGVRLGPGFTSTSPLNNTKKICNQKAVFSEKPIRKRNQKYFNPRNRKTNKMKVLRK